MAAGLSQKQIYRRVYSRLKQTQRELFKAGVSTVYKRRTLAWFDTGLAPHIDGGFNVNFYVSRASNGEVAGFQNVYLVFNGEYKEYGWQKPAGTFEQGIEQVKTLFAQVVPTVVEGWDG